MDGENWNSSAPISPARSPSAPPPANDRNATASATNPTHEEITLSATRPLKGSPTIHVITLPNPISSG
jgi:hypothetical protein